MLIISGIQVMNELNGITFFPTYFIKILKIDQKTAAYCQSVLSTATTVGRLINIFLTMKIGIQLMLFINFGSMIAGNCLIWIVGSYSLFGVYAGMILLGYGFSNAYPIIIAYVEERVTLSNKIMSLMNFSASFFLVLSPVLLGKIIDTNPSYFIILNLAITSFSFLVYVVLFILERLRLANKLRNFSFLN